MVVSAAKRGALAASSASAWASTNRLTRRHCCRHPVGQVLAGEPPCPSMPPNCPTRSCRMMEAAALQRHHPKIDR